MAKSYYSKADVLDFGSFVVSDERRGHLQRQAAKQFTEGVKNQIPWSIRERMITEDDFKLWKNGVNSKKETIEEITRILNDLVPGDLLGKSTIINRLNDLK